MNLDTFASIGLNAASAVLILALVAIGLVIIFGIMGVINLAHGAFMTLGGYTMWLVATELGLGFWVGLVATPVLVGAVGVVVDRLVIRRLYDRLIDTMLITWGVAIVITEAIKLAFGLQGKPVANPLPGSTSLGVTAYPTYRLFLIAFCLVVVAAVFALFRWTRFGIRLRAVKQDDTAAAVHGINRDRIYVLSFALGTALTGLAGAAVAPLLSVGPTMGRGYLVQSFLAVILGGSASLIGVIPGSAVVAGLSSVLSFSIQPVTAETIVLATVIVLIVFRSKIIAAVARVRRPHR